MLVIRMQRSGRKGHAMFRVIVQDSRRTPTSGKLVAQLGSYDPHAKTVIVDTEKAKFYLDHGAQPSERVAKLFTSEGIKLPSWVLSPDQKNRSVRNADKRRSTRPEVPKEPTVEDVETSSASEEPTLDKTESSAVVAEVMDEDAPVEKIAEVSTPEPAEASEEVVDAEIEKETEPSKEPVTQAEEKPQPEKK